MIYLAYIAVLVPLLRRRLATNEPLGSGQGRLSRPTGIVLDIVALIWLAIGAVNMAWPRAEFYGNAVYQQYSAVIFVPAVILVGAVYYLAKQRNRPATILKEHAMADARRAEIAPERVLESTTP